MSETIQKEPPTAKQPAEQSVANYHQKNKVPPQHNVGVDAHIDPFIRKFSDCTTARFISTRAVEDASPYIYSGVPVK